MKKSVLSALILAFAVSTLVTAPARAADQPTSTADLSFWYVISAAASTDPAYSAALGATSIVGRLNGGIMFNGTLNLNAKYARVWFFQPFVVLDPNVASCVQKAVTVGATQLQLGPSSVGPNAMLNIKVTGDVRLNEGNGGYDAGSSLTIVEVRSLKSIACEATFFYPNWP